MVTNPIPHRYLFVWTGPRFPLFARLAIESVVLADPLAAIDVYLFGERAPDAPHLRAVARHPQVAVRDVVLEDIFAGLHAPASAYLDVLARIPAAAHSARSNLVRYGLLHRHGGIYLDTDTLCVRGLGGLLHHDAFLGEERVWRVDDHRVAGRLGWWMLRPTLAYAWAYTLRRVDARVLGGQRLLEPLAAVADPVWSQPGVNNAVMGARPGSAFVRRLLARALEVNPRVRYALGPTLVSQTARAHAADVTVLPPEVFYVEPPSYSFRFFEGRPVALPPASMLVHYVSSNHRRALDALDEAELRRRRTEALFFQLGASVLDRAASLCPIR